MHTQLSPIDRFILIVIGLSALGMFSLEYMHPERHRLPASQLQALEIRLGTLERLGLPLTEVQNLDGRLSKLEACLIVKPGKAWDIESSKVVDVTCGFIDPFAQQYDAVPSGIHWEGKEPYLVVRRRKP